MRALDLFCGAGGASLGLHMAGIDLVGAYDHDQDACDTHAANLACPVTCCDLETIDLDAIPDADLWWASPPCQAWSVAGKRDGAEDARNLFPWTLDAIEARRPSWVAIENVQGLLSWDSGRYFGGIITRLEDLGYTVMHRVLDAVWYGVPQKRKRVIIIATRTGCRFWWPHPTHGNPMDIAPLFDSRRPWVTLRKAIGGGGDEPSPTLSARRDGGGARVDGGSGARRAWRRLGINPNTILDYPSSSIRGGFNGYDRDGTIRPSAYVPGESHPSGLRRLSVPEVARLQSFPNWFRFSRKKTLANLQIGNAVPPLLAWHLGNALLSAWGEDGTPAPDTLEWLDGRAILTAAGGGA